MDLDEFLSTILVTLQHSSDTRLLYHVKKLIEVKHF